MLTIDEIEVAYEVKSFLEATEKLDVDFFGSFFFLLGLNNVSAMLLIWLNSFLISVMWSSRYCRRSCEFGEQIKLVVFLAISLYLQ